MFTNKLNTEVLIKHPSVVTAILLCLKRNGFITKFIFMKYIWKMQFIDLCT